MKSNEKFRWIRKSVANNRDLSSEDIRHIMAFTEIIESLWDSVDENPIDLRDVCEQISKMKEEAEKHGGKEKRETGGSGNSAGNQ